MRRRYGELRMYILSILMLLNYLPIQSILNYAASTSTYPGTYLVSGPA